MKRTEQAFVIGRRTRKGTTVVLLKQAGKPAIPGPWTVRAVVTPRRAS
jgi:hypothetical protein